MESKEIIFCPRVSLNDWFMFETSRSVSNYSNSSYKTLCNSEKWTAKLHIICKPCLGQNLKKKVNDWIIDKHEKNVNRI